jgi:trans-aconitate 2-methyltransferase
VSGERTTRWDPAQYARFERERAQPFFDLVARLPDGDVRSAVDLGCGDGALTRTLADRWPAATITGVDSSAEMLAKAASLLPHDRVRFVAGDARTWRADAPLDRIVSNAALQWVGDHEALLERLVGSLAPGGALGVQMPANDDAPTHRICAELWRSPRFAPRLGDPPPLRRVHEASWYGERLLALGCEVDVWETTYLHRLASAAEVVEWVKGSLLRPVLSRLAGAELAEFLDEFGARVAVAYPAGSSGVWFPFPRLFFVARREPRRARSGPR